MPSKSLRVFAGPNGSGKSTLFEQIESLGQINLGYFINADFLENDLKTKGFIDLTSFGINANQRDLDKFLQTYQAKSLFEKATSDGRNINIEVIDNVIVDKQKGSLSYEASLIGSFIRHILTNQNKSLSFETVMSHSSKIDELRIANEGGYKVYLYFVCTDDPEINVSRVNNRVAKGGHKVRVANIIGRYNRTLKNLYPAIQQSRRAFLFDNSSLEGFRLIAETFEKTIKIHVETPPDWFVKYVLPYYINK